MKKAFLNRITFLFILCIITSMLVFTSCGKKDKDEDDAPQNTVINGLVFGQSGYNGIPLLGLADSSLTDVFIPSQVNNSSVYVADGAFKGTGIVSVTFESAYTVARIGNGAFDSCTSLVSIACLDEYGSFSTSNYNLENYTSPTAYFSGCTNLSKVKGTAAFLTSLANDAPNFPTEQITTVEILPDNKNEDGFAWSSTDSSKYTSVKHVIFGEGMTKLTSYPFSCAEELTLPSTLTSRDSYNLSYFNVKRINIVDIKQFISFSYYCFPYPDHRVDLYLNGELVTDVVIPEGVTEIPGSVFAQIANIKSVSFPSTLTRIGFAAFEGTELVSVTIPDSVTYIERYAFGSIPSLYQISLGKGIKTVSEVFDSNIYNKLSEGKTAPTEVHNPGQISLDKTTLASAPFIYTDADVKLGLMEIGDYIFSSLNGEFFLSQYRGNETNLTLPADVNGNSYAVRGDAFKGKEIQTLVLSNGVTSLEKSALSGIIGLTELTLGEGLTIVPTIPASVEKLNIPGVEFWLRLSNEGSDGIKGSNTAVYLNGNHITEVSVPNTVTAIRDYAFYNWKGLEKITVPNSVTELGKYSIYGQDITEIIGCESVVDRDENAIYNENTIGTHVYGNILYRLNVAIAPVSADISWARFKPGTVIPDRFFEGCKKLAFTYIPLGCTFGERLFIGTNYFVHVMLEDDGPKSVMWRFIENDKLLGDFISGTTDRYGMITTRCAIYKDFAYKYSNKEVVIIGYFGESSHGVIPKALEDGTPVSKIDMYAFQYRDGIDTLTVEAGGGVNPHYYALTGNNTITSINFGSASVIYDLSFYTNTTVSSVIIEYNADEKLYIQSAFMGCTGLTEIVLPKNLYYVAIAAFAGCDSLTSVYYGGTAEEWANTEVEKDGNENLFEATLYFYSEEQPTDTEGSYWHYVDGVPTAW